MLIKHCLKFQRIKQVVPNIDISKSYLEQAEKTLRKILQALDEQDFLWASVKIYYAAYYSLCAFLRRIGLDSDIHDCSIRVAAKILEDNDMEITMNILKQSRIDNQYYLKISDKKTLLDNYDAAKSLYIKFYNLCNEPLENYVQKVNALFGNA